MARLFFEDFRAGEVAEYGGLVVTAADIVAFARDFDPQDFHLDEAAGQAVAGGLIASGWHTASLLQRMNCDAFLSDAATLDDPGLDEVKWMRPVRPGDRLGVRRTILSTRPSSTRAEGGDVEFLFEVVNGAGEVAMTQQGRLTLARRAAGQESG